ncbi:hypothetical protein [uncultured Massilia sp.]|uniref:HD domain-containing protein n=1 Tax=uncultured Massilia sp. TaxID=169973 RepID=UPI0025E63931|nr:hypothetical protein [uncultured Massilia sp.]
MSAPMCATMRTWRRRWRQAWRQLGLPAPPAAVLRDLLQRYRAPHRHYHTLQHLDECFAALDRLAGVAAHPGEIALALWFHDAVYDVHRHDNEARSAALASGCLRTAGAADEVVRRVHALVMATQSHAPDGDPDRAVLLDVDLAILAAPPARFAQYERQVRAEYAHVAEADYRAARRRVLDGFLARPRIYHTAWFFAAYEASARANLGR